MDIKTVEKVAKLARLQLKKEEAEAITGKLSSILTWIEQLSEVNTDAVSIEGEDEKLRFRKDEVTDGDCKDSVLANAPRAEFDCFVVPKVIE